MPYLFFDVLEVCLHVKFLEWAMGIFIGLCVIISSHALVLYVVKHM